MIREITFEDYNSWCNFLAVNYPEIDVQLPNQIFANGSIFAFKPAKMSEEDYDIYTRILKKWMSDKGVMQVYRDEIAVFIPERQAATLIYTDSIVGVVPVTGNTCRIQYKDESGEAVYVVVNESAEAIKRRALIAL